jgi:biotin carboxyl carrier protein
LTKYIVFRVLILISLMLLTQCEKEQSEKQALVVNLYLPKNVNTPEKTWLAQVRSTQTEAYSFSVGGRLVQLSENKDHFEVGDTVRKGQVLAVIESDQEDLNVASLHYQKELADKNLSRLDTLLKAKTISLIEYEKQKAIVLDAQSQWNSLQKRKSDKVLVARFSGVILSSQAQKGMVVAPGQVLFEIGNPQKKEVQLWANPEESASLKKGTSLLAENCKAVISSRGMAAHHGIQSVSIRAKINSCDELLLGQKVNLSVLQNSDKRTEKDEQAQDFAQNSVLIPMRMLVSPLQDVSQIGVYGVDAKPSKEGLYTVVYHKVQVLEIVNDYVRVAGIQSSDKLIDLGSAWVQKGDLVKVQAQ